MATAAAAADDEAEEEEEIRPYKKKEKLENPQGTTQGQ